MYKNNKKRKTYSNNFKEKVIKEYLEGKGSLESLAKKYAITSRKTVYNWLDTYRKNGNSFQKAKTNQKEIDYKERYEILKKYQAFLKELQEKK